MPALHTFFLTLAWRNSGYLCSACAVFLSIEAALAGLLVFASIKKRYPVLLSLAGAFLLMSVILLAYDPSGFGHVLPDSGVPENAPTAADDKLVALGEAAAFEGRVAGELPVSERHSGGAVVTHTAGGNTGATLAPAAADDPGVVIPDKASFGEKERERFSAMKASSGEREKEPLPAAEKPLVAVMTTDGRQVQLDVSRRPLLYFSWWCPACREVLREVGGLPKERRPYLVAVCYTGIDVSRSARELAEAGLADTELYVSRGSPGDALPALLLIEGGKAKTVNGKNAVLREVWKGEA